MMPKVPVERRPSARIVRRALDEVKAIQTLLADVYKDSGGGHTLVRELVQNADDAEADRLVLAIVDTAWREATNSLLNGPALVVANSGRFPAKDHEALHQALGGSKADEAGKIGRFGVGLKSVFHICEAFVYVGADRGVLRPGALNPWAGTGEHDDADPLHPDWDSVNDDDLERLLSVATTLLGSFDNGLLQWIPLRRPTHLNRAQERQYGLGQACPEPDHIAAWFARLESLALLLAQCGHLLSIETVRAPDPRALTSPQQRTRVVRPAFHPGAWIGRHDRDVALLDRVFQGRIESSSGAWSVTGAEVLGSDSLTRLRDTPDWPTDEHWQDGRSRWIPRKALAHAAITVLRPRDATVELSGARLRWAVFLPLDNDPNPPPSTIVEPLGRPQDFAAWEIIMHGYFWPSHDRRSIPGVTDDDTGAGDSAVRTRWNRAVRDELLLPLLPRALANALEEVSEGTARSLLEAVADSRTVHDHLPSITRRHWLLPVATENGLRWEVHRPAEVCLLSIPQWTQAPRPVREQFAEWTRRSEGVLFIDDNAPRLGGDASAWPLQWVESLLSRITTDSLQSTSDLGWTESLLRHLLGSPADSGDARAALVARWLTTRIAEGVLSSTPKSASPDVQARVRDGWRRIFLALPRSWLVDAPIATQSALVQVAKAGAVGAGLLPIPLGRRVPDPSVARPDVAQLDVALLKLGTSLRDETGTSQRGRRSRLLLAETLLSVREAVPLGEELSQLPLLRAQRLPADADEAWSIADLRDRTERHRVFARPSEDLDDNTSALDAPPDPKRAVKDLAEALGEPVWVIESSVADTVGVPQPTPAALALAVLSTNDIRSGTAERSGLLRRLAKPDSGVERTDHTVRRAIVALLTGRVAVSEDHDELYYVRRRDSKKVAHRTCVEILLRLLGKAWSHVEPALIEALPHVLVEELCVTAVDFGVLHNLLRKVLDEATDWSVVESEALELLRHLHGTEADDRARWRQMPLHRLVSGARASFDERALRAVGELRLPSELEAEIRLLAPDAEVADLYLDVPALDEDGILRAMLVSRRPHQFVDEILHTLHSSGDSPVVLPRDSTLLDLLQNASWLPHRDDDSGIAPRMLLILPPAVEEGVVPLARAGVIGNYRLVRDIPPAEWEVAKEVAAEILRRPSSPRQVQRLANAIDRSRIADLEGGTYSLLPDPARLDVHLIDDAINSVLAGSHRGWSIIRAAANAVGIDGGRPLHDAPGTVRDAIVGIAQAFCGPVRHPNQISALMALASARPAKDSPSGRLFRSLLEAFAQTDVFFPQVLPHIELPTLDGQWHGSGEIARSASGVARRHRVLTELRAPLGLDSNEPVRGQAVSEAQIGSGTVQALTRYFEPWAGRLPHAAIGAFLALFGNGRDQSILRLSRRWLGDDVSVEGMRRELTQGLIHDPWASVKVFVSGYVARGERVQALNLLGTQVAMGAGTDDETLFATDPIRRSSMLGYFWEIGMRDVTPRSRTAHELVALLGATVEWWAVRVLQVGQQTVRSWWSRWGIGSQAQIGPVRASILAHLPLTLQQLDVRERPALNDALRDAQRAQRMREQATPEQLSTAIKTERLALDTLASLIRDDSEHQRFIWTRVQEQMTRFGYRADSVLLELAQNADDALSQAAEIAGSALSPAARRLIVRLAERDGVPTVDVIHYGRSINDTGGPAFPAGRDRQWDQDLYFMMLLNLSGKPGEAPERTTAASTTGEFGLGFKSIHLVSETPSVVSGFLAFSIAGSLLPVEQPVPDESDLLAVDGRLATRVRLPLRGDIDSVDLINRMFRRFAYAKALLPAFARGIREVVVDGGPHAGVTTFDSEPIAAAPGWSVSSVPASLAGHGEWRLLRFRPADAAEGIGTTALVIGLHDGAPKPLPSEVPFLWNVMPTSEGWGCGYALNGPFRLDPGRTHVSLDDSATRRVVDRLGETLGQGLVDLQDALATGAPEATSGLPVGEDAARFLACLWKVLASGIDSRDELRREILIRLQGPGRGLSVWMSTRSVVPSGLPAPFPERLPVLTADLQVEVAAAGLDDAGLCHAFAQVHDLASLARRHHIVSNDVAQSLRPLLRSDTRDVRPSDILRELADSWDHALTPERLHALRPLAPDPTWKAISDGPHHPSWNSGLRARSTAGNLVSLRKLLLPQGLAMEQTDPAIEDELRRAAFAPDNHVLDHAYVTNAADLTLFLRLRERHEIDATIMASWYVDLPAEQRPAALRYLLNGRLQNEVLERLVPLAARPPWLREYQEVQDMLTELGEDQWRTRALLAALFPERFEVDTQRTVILSASERRTFFEGLERWWNDPSVRRRVIASYEQDAWPDWLRQEDLAAGLRGGSQNHWLGLLVLGACRSLGRARTFQHRDFVQFIHDHGWWEVYTNPNDTTRWMDTLRVWQDNAVDNLKWARWMSLVPTIYQLSRHLATYQRLLRSAGRRPAELYQVTSILAPRVDEALTGAGQQFDAPPAPLDMGLHWVLRELVRLGVIDGEHLFQDCWVPSEQVLRLLRPLGLEPPDSNTSNAQKARSLYTFMASELNTAAPHLHRAFDIPLRHIDTNSPLRRQLGLEN